MPIPSWLSADLDAALSANQSFSGQALVLSTDANSDLLESSKESSKEFFGTVFSPQGPLWQAYSRTRMGFVPQGCRHANFVGGRLYFARNVEKRFLRAPGPEKSLELSGGKVVERVRLTPENLVLALSMPFDSIGQAVDGALIGLYADEKMRAFPAFSLACKKFAQAEISREAPWETAAEALAGAVSAMEYSFSSSLAAAFKAPLADSPAWRECELERLDSLLARGPAVAAQDFGFHSASPYDISLPRLSESLSQAARMRVPAPKDKHARFRENARMACSRFLSVERKAFLAAGQESGLGELVFHLRAGELEQACRNPAQFRRVAAGRKAGFEAAKDARLPTEFAWSGGVWTGLDGVVPLKPAGAPQAHSYSELPTMEIRGLPVGAPVVRAGQVVWVDSDADYLKDVRGKVVASRSFSPSLATLYDKAVGVVSVSGGALAHSAIVAREMGIACVVRAPDASKLKEGQEVSVDGKTGLIAVL